MNTEENINRLQQNLDQLARQLNIYQKEIEQLKKELPAQNTTPQQRILQENTPAESFRQTPPEKKLFRLENFVGLKLIHFVGIIVLVAGISIGVKYALDQRLISTGMRIVLAYLTGSLLFILAIFLRSKYKTFSAILFSGAMASLYFTSFAAYVYYAFLSQWLAFLLMIAFTLFTVYVAIRYRRQEIALLGMVGAYSIPFLIGKNSGNFFEFFSYIFLINCGILIIHFLRDWKLLKYLSFVFTWTIFIAWCIGRYTSRQYHLALGYGICFFLLFLTSSLAYHAIRKQAADRDDVLIICANSIALYSAALLVYLKYDYPGYSSGITLTFSLFHLLMALLTRFTLPVNARLINALLLMALAWFVLYVPIKFSGLTITVIWVLTAIILFIIGLWQKLKILRIASIFLFAITLIKLLFLDNSNFSTLQKIISYLLVGAVLLIISFLYHRYRQTIFGEDQKNSSR
jgi:uncharacterized membrane protein